ncbi:MAG: hypothetical protein LLG04_00655 [Parachlamydia sp.]|nr:hypothetical protein [Parachlamydia sp.]
MHKYAISLLLLLSVSCRREGPPPIFSVVEIAGRETSEPIYRAKMPEGWEKQQPAYPNTDTTKALAEFFLRGPEGTIRLTFHNFPSEQDIPPMAQITRWKKQFEHLDPGSVSIDPKAFSGFIGFFFEGSGQLSGETKIVLGWAMQLAPQHFQFLQTPVSRVEASRFRQMRASFTIKTVGPKELMAKHQKAIIAFAESFELIDELPSQL